MRPAILLFAKAPVPGRVKTRLSPPLSPEEAALLHSAFVQDQLAKLQRLPAELRLYVDTPTDAGWAARVPQFLQTSGDLGQRMQAALEQVLAEGHCPVMIVGADAPTLPLSHLEQLLAAKADLAFGPAEDGGYYALSARRIRPGQFAGVAWSTSQALQQSVAAAERVGLTSSLGPCWFDVDEPADLLRLAAEVHLPPHTAAVLQRLRAKICSASTPPAI